MTDAVQLFPTCLAEQFFPAAVDAAAAVLERQGLKVRATPRVFCCGQVAFNEGLRDEARGLARCFLDQVDPRTPIVIPSGSCATMVKIFYRDLLAGEPALVQRTQALGGRVFEFSQFLVNALKVTDVGARFERAVTYQPSCHLLRELGARQEPMRLLSAVRGIRLCELRDREECCGFGGLFAVKFPHISAAMMEDKLERVAQSGAQVLVANDCGCLMHLAGGANRRAMRLETMHLAQVLASR